MDKEYEIIWLKEMRTFGYLMKLNAHYSIVKCERGGMDYELIVENEEIEHLNEGELDD